MTHEEILNEMLSYADRKNATSDGFSLYEIQTAEHTYRVEAKYLQPDDPIDGTFKYEVRKVTHIFR